MRRWISRGAAALAMGGLFAGIWHLAHHRYALPHSPYHLSPVEEARLTHYFPDAARHGNYEVTAETLKRWMEAGTPLVLIDVRQPGGAKGFRSGHIEGALNIPLQWMGRELTAHHPYTERLAFASQSEGHYEATIQFFPLPRHERIVVMCYDGNGGQMTPALLRTLGYDAYGLKDGVALWNDKLNVWPRWADAAAAVNWPVAAGDQGAFSLQKPTAGDDRLGLSAARRVAAFFRQARHPYPTGYAYPWTIEPDALAADLASPHPPQVIDLRSPEAFRRSHIPHSINIPFQDLGANLNRINPAERVVLVSQSLQRAAQANAIMRLMGYRSDVLKQGLADWNRSLDTVPHSHEYPVVRGK